MKNARNCYQCAYSQQVAGGACFCRLQEAVEPHPYDTSPASCALACAAHEKGRALVAEAQLAREKQQAKRTLVAVPE